MNILRPGAPARKTLDELEKTKTRLEHEIKVINDAFIPEDELRARLNRQFEMEMSNKVPEHQFALLRGKNDGYAALPNTIGFADLVFVFGIDAIVDLVMARITADGKPMGLPAADRAKRIAELRSEIRDAQRAAELEALKLEEAGYNVLRCSDADPEVIFEVWATLPASAPRSAPAATQS